MVRRCSESRTLWRFPCDRAGREASDVEARAEIGWGTNQHPPDRARAVGASQRDHEPDGDARPQWAVCDRIFTIEPGFLVSRRRRTKRGTDHEIRIGRRCLMPAFRLGIYVFKDVEIVDFAAPHGVFSVARRFNPELDAFLIADAMRPVQAQAGFTVLPNYSFSDRPAMDALLIPGGYGTRQELHNGRLHEFIRSLPDSCLLTSVCTGSWIYGKMGLLDGLPATNRKEPDRVEQTPPGKVPIDRLAEIAPKARISRARVVDAGRSA